MLSKKVYALLMCLTLSLSACVLDDGAKPSAAAPTLPEENISAKTGQTNNQQMQLAANSVDGPITNPQSQTVCTYPAGWQPYQVQINETIYSIAARGEVNADQILAANCFAPGTVLGVGRIIYVPSSVATTTPDTLLPLGISAIVVDPPTVTAGGKVNLTWQSQGPVVSVRVGWVYNGQFIEETRNLPKIGTWQFAIPDDGRQEMTLMVRVSDGTQEVAAQTLVKVACGQSWFFSPDPTGCPSPSLVTTFQEQTFEHGRIVYLPTLGVNYLLIDGQPSIKIGDSYLPGMPLKDAGLESAVPQGMQQPSGSFYYAWRVNEDIRNALGWAISNVVEYSGVLQRAIDTSGERVYFTAGSGGIYRTGGGQGWALLFLQ
ncbi:MAG: LysM peptidoglycan-binding domain-containing protein [Chloroflexi bacterium]|nr:LysM peptidoglycan-binding domain-containing protein [Chloroflexota bacterium]